MATGIVSQAMRLDGAGTLSGLLLGAAAVAYAALAAASAWRFAAWRAAVLADLADPARVFGFYTFAAASGVLAARLAAGGHPGAAVPLAALGAVAWLLLSSRVPVTLARWQGPPPALASANGSWFLWAVGIASAAVAVCAMPFAAAAPFPALALACWAAGVVLYLAIAAAVTGSLLRYPRRPADLTPPYWIFMGGSAICVLAGALILQLPPGAAAPAGRAVVAAACVALWSLGTALIPVLAAAGVWRHLVHRVPLRYELGLWSIVFPLGMDSVASRELGWALHIPWLASWGGAEAWAALAAWLAVSAALLTARRPRRP
jgi:tellurite resistance protein TehA-like permease